MLERLRPDCGESRRVWPRCCRYSESFSEFTGRGAAPSVNPDGQAFRAMKSFVATCGSFSWEVPWPGIRALRAGGQRDPRTQEAIALSQRVERRGERCRDRHSVHGPGGAIRRGLPKRWSWVTAVPRSRRSPARPDSPERPAVPASAQRETSDCPNCVRQDFRWPPGGRGGG